jgi:diacylglycerol kinase (ATP)
MKVVLLHNKSAGEGEWTRRDLLRLLRRKGFQPDYFPLQEALDKPELMDRGEFVVVAGGDGTIRKAASQLLGRGRPLAPLPLGTANNIARSLGLHGSPKKIVAGWKKARRVRFDAGMAKGPWGRRPFVEGVGLGLISRTIVILDAIDKASAHEFEATEHQLHRDVCVVAALAHEMQPIPAQLSTGRRRQDDNFLLLEVLNIGRAGPALELAPESDPTDGWLHVVTVADRQRQGLIKMLHGRLADEEQTRSLKSTRTRHVRLKIPPCELRIDDVTVEVKRNATIELSLLRGALEFVLPGK